MSSFLVTSASKTIIITKLYKSGMHKPSIAATIQMCIAIIQVLIFFLNISTILINNLFNYRWLIKRHKLANLLTRTSTYVR